jgi:dTDP-4-amino-4,6-dideoxygalactose transaminase
LNSPIYVTRPFLPPLAELQPYLEQIWENRQLTNAGPFHQQFERSLCEYLGVDHISLFANGTLALVTALQALRITGEVITTPYSFVATAHSLLWNGIKPVFVDIDPETLNLDAEKVEVAITPLTTAILPVHVYGRPCAIDRIQQIADTYGLKVIYDAAHAFAVEDKGGSILRHGDLSILSFHATKVFTTFEGGAIISPDEKTKKRIDYLKNFGFADEVTVVAPGINGKMNEFQAAMGLLQLKYVDAALAQRAEIDRRYRELLADIPGIRFLPRPDSKRHNYSYFPVLIEPEYPLTRDELYQRFRENNIYVRRYFYPLISEFPMYRALPSASKPNLTNASTSSEKILCLPIYPDLELTVQKKIVILLTGKNK